MPKLQRMELLLEKIHGGQAVQQTRVALVERVHKRLRGGLGLLLGIDVIEGLLVGVFVRLELGDREDGLGH